MQAIRRHPGRPGVQLVGSLSEAAVFPSIKSIHVDDDGYHQRQLGECSQDVYSWSGSTHIVENERLHWMQGQGGPVPALASPIYSTSGHVRSIGTSSVERSAVNI
jgi:hypothetical protein